MFNLKNARVRLAAYVVVILIGSVTSPIIMTKGIEGLFDLVASPLQGVATR